MTFSEWHEKRQNGGSHFFTNSFILFVAKVGQGRRVIQDNWIQSNDTQRN
jgi:hypothetical protein